MAFWDFLNKKSAVSTTVNDVVQQSCEFIRPPLGSTYSDAKSVEQYRSWVYVAASYNARSVATADLELYTNIKARVARTSKISKDRYKQISKYCHKSMMETERVENHPILELLNKPNANDNLNSFLYKVDLFLELTGDAYILIGRDDRGLPATLDVLFAQYVNVQTDGLNQIIAYNYGIATNGKYEYSFKPEDIIHIKFFDPAEIHTGISPLEAGARSAGLIESMNTYEEAINRNMGVVSGILKQNGKVKPDQRAEFESKWQKKFSGVGRSGKVVVTDADIDYQNIGIAPRDMQFLDGRKWSREEILACYGVPTALLFTDDVNRSNMVTSSIGYYHNTVQPRLQLISQSITNQLINENGINGKDLFITLTREAPEDTEINIEKASLLVQSGALTRNELRVMLGQPPIEGTVGDELINVNAKEVL
jgi:HK97 family phage portal protein